MASDETTTAITFSTPTITTSLDDDDYNLDGDDECDAMSTTHLLMSDHDHDDVDRGMSQLSLDAADEDELTDDNDVGGGRVSRPMWIEEYASETDSPGGPRRKVRSSRERFLNRAWEMRRCSSGGTRRHGLGSPDGDLECRLMVRPRGREGGIRMDMQEVKACRDLGLALPSDWTLEISGAGDTSSGGSSPISDWRISSPGDSPRDVKARLKVWAQAVALASSTRLSN